MRMGRPREEGVDDSPWRIDETRNGRSMMMMMPSSRSLWVSKRIKIALWTRDESFRYFYRLSSKKYSLFVAWRMRMRMEDGDGGCMQASSNCMRPRASGALFCVCVRAQDAARSTPSQGSSRGDRDVKSHVGTSSTKREENNYSLRQNSLQLQLHGMQAAFSFLLLPPVEILLQQHPQPQQQHIHDNHNNSTIIPSRVAASPTTT